MLAKRAVSPLTLAHTLALTPLRGEGTRQRRRSLAIRRCLHCCAGQRNARGAENVSRRPPLSPQRGEGWGEG